ncbi:hypothetical protein N0V90_003505 [Kalmusia sp. IMI 367209]|nr:hypothetical protein N0V90_003505 [Kalmusia sp. IMI 367209]
MIDDYLSQIPYNSTETAGKANTKRPSINHQWTTSDRYSIPSLPEQQSPVHFPRLTSSSQNCATQPQSPQTPPTSAFGEPHILNEVYAPQRVNLLTPAISEAPAEWQEVLVTANSHFAHLGPSPQATVHAPVNRWQQARDYRRKVYQPPYVDPQIDHTIPNVETNAEFWVDQLIIAMSNTEDVKDTPNSHHRRLFLAEYLDPLLIEACCREIFTALIDRCKNGFRGPAHFNKALKASHTLGPDRTATCEERICNVVKVLSWNKRACKDVLYEDWKIRLLVNHPLAYDKEKDSQKGSNDQRRKRQLADRERMQKTEEELRTYREANGNVAMGIKGISQLGDAFAYGAHVQPESWPQEWLCDKYDGAFSDVDNDLGKRPGFEEPQGNDAKRQRL